MPVTLSERNPDQESTYRVTACLRKCRESTLMCSDRKQSSGCPRVGVGRGGRKEGGGDFLRVMGKLIILIMVTVSQSCTYVKIYQVAHFK